MTTREFILILIAIFIGVLAAIGIAALIAKKQIQDNVSTNSILAALIK